MERSGISALLLVSCLVVEKLKFLFAGISKLVMSGRKELKKLLHSDQDFMAQALLNSIKKRDLLMLL